MPEKVPENGIEHEQEGSCSEKMPDDMGQHEQAEAASSSTKLSDIEKSLSKISMLECLQALFQLNPSLAKRGVGSGDALDMAETSNSIPNAVLSEYFRILDRLGIQAYWVLDYLKEMVDEHPQVLMEVSPKYHRTYLHIAVMANSEVEVRKLLRMLIANKDIEYSSNSRKSHLPNNAEFLRTVESVSGFTAIQMACVVGNRNITDMIKDCQKAIERGSGLNIPASLDETDDEEAKDSEPRTEELKQQKAHIRRIGEVLTSYLDPLGFDHLALEATSLGDEFKLHSSLIVGDDGKCMCRWVDYSASNDIKKLLQSIVSQLAEESLLSTFLALRDNAGKNVLHYLVDFSGAYALPGMGDDFRRVSDIIFSTLIREFDQGVPQFDVNVRDYVGRTPLHLAAAQGFTNVVEHFANDVRTNLNATYNMSAPGSLEDGTMQRIVGISALSLAATHNHSEGVKRLLNAPRSENGLDVNLQITTVIGFSLHSQEGYFPVSWTPFQVAAFKGHMQTLEVFLSDDRLHDFGLISQPRTPYPRAPHLDHRFVPSHNEPALHLAAYGSKPYAIKALLRSDRIDPFAINCFGNTALHSAFDSICYGEYRGPWDFVNIFMCTWNPRTNASKVKNSGEMIGCLDLLFQAGLDMDQPNKNGFIPQLWQGTPPEVQQWWYDKLAKVASETKKNIVAASNAISVTSALVAATSFVGPLQPPLGLSNNSDAENMWYFGYSQVNHVAVDIFLFFDSLSFYLAIASIMLALIPSLPTQHEGLFLEVKKAQRILQGAIALLFASITFLICTFSAASIAIIPKGRWKYKSIVVSTSIFGGTICFIVLILFVRRLWRLIKPRKH